MLNYYILSSILLISILVGVEAEKIDYDDTEDTESESVEIPEPRTHLLVSVQAHGAQTKIKTDKPTADEDEETKDEQPKDLIKKYESVDTSKIWEMQQKVQNYSDNEQENRNRQMECVSCFSKRATSTDPCYTGTATSSVKCSDPEKCFTELHPNYIKRGCLLPSSISITHACKCPLCNDKPYKDLAYYTYATIMDWKYDNQRIQQPLPGLHLLCKSCDTSKNANPQADAICKEGNSSEHITCGEKQLCYTNVNFLNDTVSRGCVDLPVYNKLNIFCNYTRCNNIEYDVPLRRTLRFGSLTDPHFRSSVQILRISQFHIMSAFCFLLL